MSALQAEISALRARVAELEAALPSAKKSAAPRQEDDGVKIFVSLPAVHPKHLPTADEAAVLVKIVTARYQVSKCSRRI
jgi:hypothetical protein